VSVRVQNSTRSTLLGDAIRLADSSQTRRTGLLKSEKLVAGQGLWIVPCSGIHMFFMKFAIDAVFIDKKRRVRKAVPNLAPWKIALCLGAHSVIELPVGTIESTQTEKGDQLTLDIL